MVIINKGFGRDAIELRSWLTLGNIRSFSSCLHQGACVGGHDDSPGDHPSANAADPPAASPVSSAAPGPSPAAAGGHAAAGNVGYLLWNTSSCVDSAMGINDKFFLHWKGQLVCILEYKCSIVIAELPRKI